MVDGDDVEFSLTWKDRDTQAISKEVDEQLLFALIGYAKANSWNQTFAITGYTSISKLDLTTNTNQTYRSDPNYRGKKWQDWGLFNFEDDSKPENTVNAGLILGFIKFDTPGFPSPRNIESYPDGVPQMSVDRTSYVVACCSPNYHNVDKKNDNRGQAHIR